MNNIAVNINIDIFQHLYKHQHHQRSLSNLLIFHPTSSASTNKVNFLKNKDGERIIVNNQYCTFIFWCTWKNTIKDRGTLRYTPLTVYTCFTVDTVYTVSNWFTLFKQYHVCLYLLLGKVRTLLEFQSVFRMGGEFASWLLQLVSFSCWWFLQIFLLFNFLKIKKKSCEKSQVKGTFRLVLLDMIFMYS